jgi:hypothetical protein
LNTWLPEECKSNSDVACFCPKPDFTKNVFECIKAHGGSQSEIDQASKYFQGLCAPYIPTNPGLVTDCPEEGESPVLPPPEQCTTIVIQTTVWVPCTPESGDVTTSSTQSVIHTTVTVPAITLTSGTSDVHPVPQTPVAPAAPTYAPVTPTGAPAPVVTPTGVVPPVIIPTGGSIGTVTKPAPLPVFTGAASKGSVGAGVLGAAVAFAMLV